MKIEKISDTIISIIISNEEVEALKKKWEEVTNNSTVTVEFNKYKASSIGSNVYINYIIE